MEFVLAHQDLGSSARAGVITTSRGSIQTPIFMPVGTMGTVRAVHQRELEGEVDASIILANTYHLYLRPGTDILEKAGGIHKFMNWHRPLLTDSGGYQVYSLAQQRKIKEEGVIFKAPIDGSTHFFTPEYAIDIQRSIGADIIMAFDECTPPLCSYDYCKASVERTHRWLKRCLVQMAHTAPKYGHPQSLFPIVQGGIYKDLRLHAAHYVANVASDGYAIGGVCHTSGHLYEVTHWVCEVLPKDKPRYMMGVGTPEDLLECIGLGVDMFDCVMPARNARNGMLFTTQGIISIKKKKWKEDFSPIDPLLKNYASRHYTKAYLHHLMRVEERLGAQIATLQNLCFYLWLVRQARARIIAGDFATWKKTMIAKIMHRL
ncbi:MAG: tRNA guanosine(34) transglycosylase Tgt [Bacteroidota bacterium]